MIEPRPKKFEDTCEKTKTYEQGLEEAWEIARRLVLDADIDNDNYNRTEIGEIFGDDRYSRALANYSIHEVKAKIDAWEAEKNKPKLGDVVEIYGGSGEFYHTGIFIEEEEKDYIVLLKTLHHTQAFSKINFRLEKTGKHFDIQGMLDEISGK